VLKADKFSNVSPEYSGRLTEFCHHANKQTVRKTSVIKPLQLNLFSMKVNVK